jgi:hypothetical protein
MLKMAEQTETVDDEVTKLRARVKRLEAERDRLKKTDGDDDVERRGRHVADSLNDARRSKGDTAVRVARGMTLASFEFVRLFADSISAFSEEVIDRNESRSRGGRRSVTSLATRLPEDVADGFASALDRFSDIPARAADRYSKTYRQGDNTDRHDDKDDD